MGASLGWATSFNAFVETALLAYVSGATASELSNALDARAFEQAGQLLRSQWDGITVKDVNAEAFRRWLSTTFATWAIVGVPHAKAASADTYGWAWAPGAEQAEDAIVEVYRHFDFVAASIRNMNGTAADLGERFRADVTSFNCELDLRLLASSAAQAS